MTAIETPQGAEFSVTGIIARITAALQTLAAQPLSRLSAGSQQPAQWLSLDDRLLRDIGASPLDAQIARLHARRGAAEANDTGRRCKPGDKRRPVHASDEARVLSR